MHSIFSHRRLLGVLFQVAAVSYGSGSNRRRFLLCFVSNRRCCGSNRRYFLLSRFQSPPCFTILFRVVAVPYCPISNPPPFGTVLFRITAIRCFSVSNRDRFSLSSFGNFHRFLVYRLELPPFVSVAFGITAVCCCSASNRHRF